MSDRIDTLVDQLANVVRLPSSERPPVRKCFASLDHARVSKLRADHDRVPLEEFERELRLNRLANDGEQSEAARVLDVTEGCLRHWRRGRWLPPRWAVTLLRERRENLSPARRVAG